MRLLDVVIRITLLDRTVDEADISGGPTSPDYFSPGLEIRGKRWEVFR